MTQPAHRVTIERKVPSMMRDGNTLFCDVYRPEAPGRYPVIVERVAYELESRVAPYAEFYASRGYVFVGQNTRGTYWSEGEFRGLLDDGWGENRDGYDTIEWAAAQPWSDGSVGTMDGSWSGMTQVMLAPTRPPHLRTMFLRMAPAGDGTAGGGIPSLGLRVGLLNHTLQRARHPSAPERLRSFVPAIEKALERPSAILDELPAARWPLIEEIYPHLGALLGAAPLSPESLRTDATRQAHEIDVPAFHLGGWFDIFLESTVAMFAGISERGFSERARRNQRMLIGPWVHGPMEPNNRMQGDLDFGPEAELGINEFRLAWFDHWLKGVNNGVASLPPVRLFVMGENRWRDFESWPPQGGTPAKLFLRAGPNGGSLSFEPPVEPEASTAYDYDPFKPVPAADGGRKCFQAMGPVDLAPSEGRLAVFTSPPLEKPLTVIGPVRLHLWATSSARDTDWFVTLSDMHPDNRSIRVQEGALRARYREGFDREALMEPGRPYRFSIDIKATAQRFEAGHRVRVAITSSRFPPSERNMNTGRDNAAETSGMVAHNTLLHDRAHPSHLELPAFA